MHYINGQEATVGSYWWDETKKCIYEIVDITPTDLQGKDYTYPIKAGVAYLLADYDDGVGFTVGDVTSFTADGFYYDDNSHPEANIKQLLTDEEIKLYINKEEARETVEVPDPIVLPKPEMLEVKVGEIPLEPKLRDITNGLDVSYENIISDLRHQKQLAQQKLDELVTTRDTLYTRINDLRGIVGKLDVAIEALEEIN